MNTCCMPSALVAHCPREESDVIGREGKEAESRTYEGLNNQKFSSRGQNLCTIAFVRTALNFRMLHLSCYSSVSQHRVCPSEKHFVECTAMETGITVPCLRLSSRRHRSSQHDAPPQWSSDRNSCNDDQRASSAVMLPQILRGSLLLPIRRNVRSFPLRTLSWQACGFVSHVRLGASRAKAHSICLQWWEECFPHATVSFVMTDTMGVYYRCTITSTGVISSAYSRPRRLSRVVSSP